MRWIGELRGLGLTVAEIRELTTAWRNGTGERLAELLHRSRGRLQQHIAAQQQTLRRIEKFEAEHHADLATGDICFAGDPLCARRA